jgi:hypothetical protein
MNFKPIELSQSWLKTLLCPYRLQQLQIRGVKEEDSEEASFGTMMHSVAALYGPRCVKQKKFRDGTLYSQAMDEVVAHFKLDVDTEVKMQELGAVFLPMWSLDVGATRHAFEERLFLPRTILETQKVYSDGKIIAEMGPAQPIQTGDRLAGTPDHVAYFANRAVINEFKFGMGRNFEYDEAQHDRQVGLYAYMLLQLHPELDEVSANLIAPGYGAGNVSSGSFTRSTLGFIEEWVAAGWELVDKLREDPGDADWPAHADHEVCQWCDFSGWNGMPSCPEIVRVREQYGG